MIFGGKTREKPRRKKSDKNKTNTGEFHITCCAVRSSSLIKYIIRYIIDTLYIISVDMFLISVNVGDERKFHCWVLKVNNDSLCSNYEVGQMICQVYKKVTINEPFQLLIKVPLK